MIPLTMKPLRVRTLLGLCLALVFIAAANAQQQTYTLQTNTFSLVLNRFNVAGDGYATGIRECRYLPTGGDPGRLFTMHERWTSIANVDGGWDRPDSASVVERSSTVKDITIHFGANKRITMRVTSHPTFLEFRLDSIRGNCGTLWLFGPIFEALNVPPHLYPGYPNEYDQITYLGDGYYAGLIAANPNTGIFRHWERSNWTSRFISAISPRFLPMPLGSTYRDQRFAFFICREADLKNRVREVENYFNYPYGVSLKDDPANDIDYLFLLDESYVSAQNIIRLCESTGLGAVLLFQGFWAAWLDTTAPFKLQPWIRQVVDSLRAAGLIVGLHGYVHHVPSNGYYAMLYPDSVMPCSTTYTFKTIDWTTMLPEMVVQDFAAKVDTLRPEWIYLDGMHDFMDCNNAAHEQYLLARQTTSLLKELRRRNYNNLRIYQDPGGVLTYNYRSRIGQIDYWDDHPDPLIGTPIQHMNFMASQVVPRRHGLFRYTDLGWFGRQIHWDSSGHYRTRDARWDEWQHLCNISLNYNIPIGIRTTYNDFMTDPLRDRIVPLLRETIRRRRGLGDIGAITVVAPNGGETWPIGTSQTIQWSSSFVRGDVKIELSRNGGASFTEVLFASTPNDGIENWTVTGPATSTARVRISSVSDPSVADTSNANFSLGTTVNTVVQQGWNIVSVPVTVGDLRKGEVFPTSTSSAFGYMRAGYVIRDTLDYGVGYWLKFGTGQTVSVTGGERLVDTVEVVAGWNMIGSISGAVAVDSIVQVPSGIVVSPYFGYGSTGYSASTTIEPMKGYWVKVSQNGQLVLVSNPLPIMLPRRNSAGID